MKTARGEENLHVGKNTEHTGTSFCAMLPNNARCCACPSADCRIDSPRRAMTGQTVPIVPEGRACRALRLPYRRLIEQRPVPLVQHKGTVFVCRGQENRPLVPRSLPPVSLTWRPSRSRASYSQRPSSDFILFPPLTQYSTTRLPAILISECG